MSGIVLQTTRGVLGLIGPSIDDLALRDALESVQCLTNTSLKYQAPYHVTFLTKAELREIPSDRLDKLQADTRHIHSAGIGGNLDTAWSSSEAFPHHLSAQDKHDMDKGSDSLLPDQLPAAPTPDFLDHLSFTLHTFGQYQRAQEFSKDLILALPQSHRGFLRIADAAQWGRQHKLAMLSFACAYERSDDQKDQTYCVKRMIECSKDTEWGP